MRSRSTAKVYKLPINKLSKNRRVNTESMISYYENKIQTLMDMNLPPRLVCLACWDAPVEKEDLRTERGRKKFIKKCLKYYNARIKELERKRL